MASISPPEVERRALALFERLSEQPGNARLRDRLLRREADAVRARIARLEASATRAASLPTLIPGSGDLGGEAVPPARVGPFRLVDRIGRGGMGDVWAGQRDDGLYEQRVAVKLIQRHALARAAEAFDDERRFLARLEHPNIARLIDGGVTEDGLPWLVLEYVEGKPIDEAGRGLDLGARAQMFVKAADAVQYAHSRLVAHADLKPSNMLVGADGRVKLLDFGIAALIGDAARTKVGSGPLTRDFSSPERIAGEGPSVADDVFALGKTLELLIADATDGELKAIAAKAHAPNAADRYGSVAELIADLDRWRARLPVAAMPDRWSYRARKFVERHRQGVALTGAAMLALMAISVVATTNYLRAERARGEAAARFADARGSAHYVSFQLLDRLAAQPGTLVLRTEAAAVAQRYLDRLSGSAAATPATRLEAADGLLRLAAAQGRQGRPNLGETDEARANLARAAALALTVPGEPARLLAIRIRSDQARLASSVDNDPKASLRFLADARRLIARGPVPAAVEGQYLIELSAAEQWDGDYKAAVVSARRALAVLPSTGDRDALLRRVSALDILAEGLYFLPDVPAAVPPYRAALATAEAAVRAHPGDQIAARVLARAQWALGSTLTGNGGDAEALPLFDKAAAGIGSITAADPADADAQRMRRIIQNARAQALAANGRIDEALGIFAASLREREALWRARPGEAIRLRDYVASVKAMADMETDYGRTQNGCARYAQVRTLVDRMRAERRLTRLDVNETLIDMQRRRAKHCAAV